MDEDIIQIYYDAESDTYTDECGFTIFNIYREVPMNMIYLFKLKKDDMMVYGHHGERIELWYDQPVDYEYIHGDYDNIIEHRRTQI